MRKKPKLTMAGHAGKPFILASTRSPTFHCAAAAAAAAAADAPRFLLAGAIGLPATSQPQRRHRPTSDQN